MPSSGDEHESDNPPWYANHPDGRWNPGGVPDRLFRHPVTIQRQIHLGDAVQPGVVFVTLVAPAPALIGNQVVKILNTDKEEMVIYERLLRELHRPNNHTIPGEVTRIGHPLLLMPRLHDITAMYDHKQWTPRNLMDAILQVVEGVEYLHGKHIAHLDLHLDNLVVGTSETVAEHDKVVKDRIYIIDFDTSRQFTLGPGVQRAITLPDAVHSPPNGLTSFDPYSWDVYCMGRTLEEVIRDVYQRGEPPHWIAQKYIRWLVGNERNGGCAGVCRCRPTARTALRVLVVLRWAVCAAEGYRWMADAVARLWTTRN